MKPPSLLRLLCVRAVTAGGKILVWPALAPAVIQTVLALYEHRN